MTNEPKDRRDLKIQALLEKVSSLTTNYENQIADLRVELTVQTEEAQNLVNSLEQQIQDLKNTPVEEDVQEPA